MTSIVLELVPKFMKPSVEHLNWEIKIKGRKCNLVTRKIRPFGEYAVNQHWSRVRGCAPLCAVLRCSPVLLATVSNNR